MSEDERGRSPELDQLRQELFPDLPPADGWAQIDAAFDGASDPERIERIERIAGKDLSGDLMEILRRLRDEDEDPA